MLDKVLIKYYYVYINTAKEVYYEYSKIKHNITS